MTIEPRRRRWMADQKLQIVTQGMEPGETVSSVAREHGVVANLLYCWRRLMKEGGAVAVGSDEPVMATSHVRKLEDHVRELERLVGRKTMEVEILREALNKARSKKTYLAADNAGTGRYPVTVIAPVLGVSRSHLHDRLDQQSKSRGALRDER